MASLVCVLLPGPVLDQEPLFLLSGQDGTLWSSPDCLALLPSSKALGVSDPSPGGIFAFTLRRVGPSPQVTKMIPRRSPPQGGLAPSPAHQPCCLRRFLERSEHGASPGPPTMLQPGEERALWSRAGHSSRGPGSNPTPSSVTPFPHL